MVIGKDLPMAVWPGSTYISNGGNVLWAFTRLVSLPNLPIRSVG